MAKTSKSKSAGRRTKLTPEVQAKILERVRAGVPLKYAAQGAGIGASTLHEWRERGEGTGKRPATKIYTDFADALKRALADAIAERVALIQKAAQGGNWTAAAWWLERRYPQEFGRKDQVAAELTGKGGQPIRLVFGSANGDGTGD